MKRVIFLSVMLLSNILLVSCGDTKDHNNEKKVANTNSSTALIESSNNSENTSNEQEYLRKAAWDLEEKFNTDGQTLIKTEINNDVMDDTSDKAHSEIVVTVIDDSTRQSLEEIQDSLNSNSATDDQKTIIYGIQLNIEEVAKTLQNDADVITFIVPSQNGNNLAIAKSSKVENIIPLVM